MEIFSLMMYNISIYLHFERTRTMNTALQYVIRYIDLINISDLVDIIIVAALIYSMIRLIRGTRATQLVKGVAILLAIFLASDWLNLHTLHYLLSSAIQIGLFAIVVIFQPELRNILEHIGRIKIGNIIDFGSAATDADSTEAMIQSVVTTARNLAQEYTGALIVIERQTKLGDYIRTGTNIDAAVSSRLLENIFVPNTPLHDGAVIISKNRISAASCLLPLSANNNLSRDLGTRHRAAIGLSECTDAVVVVVSEETGKISLALNGTLTRNLSELTLTNALKKTVLPAKDDGEAPEKFRFRRSK